MTSAVQSAAEEDSRSEPDVLEKADVSAAGLEFAIADLRSDTGWAEAVAGMDRVLHLASPFPPQAPRRAGAHPSWLAEAQAELELGSARPDGERPPEPSGERRMSAGRWTPPPADS